jgi:hypothetical protein
MRHESHIHGTTEKEWQDYISKGIDFHHFYQELYDLAEAYKTGLLDDDTYAHYYPVNLQRMKRGIKQLTPDPVFEQLIEKIRGEVTWVVLTEQWCGDGAQTLPLFYKLSGMDKKIRLTLLSRDENPELMDQFLTDGGRSIPKLIQLNEHLEVTGTWGPRPAPAQLLVKELRKKGEPYANALHTWYARDRYTTLQHEAVELLSQHIAAESDHQTKRA